MKGKYINIEAADENSAIGMKIQEEAESVCVELDRCGRRGGGGGGPRGA